MSEARSERCEHPSDCDENPVSPGLRLLRGLHSFLGDVRVAWRDPSIPVATPALRDYPVQRL